MRLYYGLVALLICTAGALGSTTLVYTGNDISTASGTMTITCNDSVQGNLWQLDVNRTSTGSVKFPTFKDLTDPGVGGVHFNYSDGQRDFFSANDGPNFAFTQVTKSTSLYKFTVAETWTFTDTTTIVVTSTYSIVPSTSTGTNLITCVRDFTNNTGVTRTKNETGVMMQFVYYLNCNPWGGNGSTPPGEFSAYATSGPANGSRTMVKTSDGTTPTFYQIWDNLNKNSPLYVAPPAYPGVSTNYFQSTTQVLNNSITSGVGITAGRTFTYNVDMAYTNQFDQFNAADGVASVYLDGGQPDAVSAVGNGTDWGYNHAGITNSTEITHTATLTVDIKTTSTPPVSNPGADVAVQDTNGTGNMNVALDGSASTGTITSWAWYLNGSTTAISTSESPTVSLPIGIDDMKLTVTGPGGSSSAVKRVWIYPTPTYWVDGLNGLDTNAGTSQGAAFKTINKATGKAVAGNTIMVLGTAIYRTGVGTTNSGSSTSPITLMGMPLQRVIVDASDLATGWTQCPSNLNTNYLKIWTTTITSANPPTQVTQTISGVETELATGGLPMGNCAGGPPFTGGRFVCTGGADNLHIADTTNLAGKYSDNYFNGASVNFEDAAGHGHGCGFKVTGYTNSTGVLTLGTSIGKTPVAGQDAYCIYNMPQLLNAPGQFAIVSNGGTSYTVYVWLTDNSNPASSGRQVAVNGNRNTGIAVGIRSYWNIDNFEVRHVWSGETGAGSNALGWNPCGAGTVVRNCLVHHCEGCGIIVVGSDGALVTHCTADYCRYPIAVNATTTSDAQIDHCESGWSWEDGLRPAGAGTANTRTMTVDTCYVHDVIGYNHSDGIQSTGPAYLGTLNFLNCLELNNFDAWQGSMGNGTQYLQTVNWTNNVLIGMTGTAVQLEGDTANINGNTVAGSSSGTWDWSSIYPTASFNNNIVCQAGAINNSKALGVQSAAGYTASYNDWFTESGETYSPVVLWPNTLNNWPQYLTSVSPQDSHSFGNCDPGNPTNGVYSNPAFANFPTYSMHGDDANTWNNTPTTAYVPSNVIGYFAVNDHIEIGWDGVVRKVTAVDTTNNKITWDTPKNDMAFKPVQGIVNWKTVTNPAFDLTLPTTSPAYHSRANGTNMGSTINVANYQAGDFNGDGRRDIPAYPPTLAVPPG